MKLFIILTVLLASLRAHSQDNVIAAYKHNPDSLISKIKNNTITGADKKDLTAIAFDLQNRGQSLDEREHDYKNSLELINKAIVVFEYLNDTLDIANNKKFKGYLLGRFGKFDEAKREIKQAIELFRSKSRESGVAVNEFDLSRVYDFENKLDSAIYYCSSGLTYWKYQHNISRIVINQTMLIHLLVKDKQLMKAKSIQEECEQLTTTTKLYWQNMIDFYWVSAQLYKALNDAELSSKYQALYHDKILELKQQNISASPYY
jgi:tetratricopeptide (TPR) repeat protein